MVGAAVESGIAEMIGLDGICWTDYTVDKADINPAVNYTRHSKGCRLANGTAILVLLTLMFTTFALVDAVVPSSSSSSPPADDGKEIKTADGGKNYESVVASAAGDDRVA